MVRTRWRAVLLGLLVLALLLVGGSVAGARAGTGPDARPATWTQLFLGRRLDPFVSGTPDGLPDASPTARAVGVVVALVVLLLVLVLGSRAGSSFATVVGAWFGSALAGAAGALAAALVVLQGAERLGPGVVARSGEAILLVTEHGLYWGTLVGWLVGAVALLGGVGGRRVP